MTDRIVYVVACHNSVKGLVGYSSSQGWLVPFEKAKIYVRRNGAAGQANWLNKQYANTAKPGTWYPKPLRIENELGPAPPVPIRYTIVFDHRGERYLIPVGRDNAVEWQAWAALPEDDPLAWDVPPYAIKLEGEYFSFEKPRIGTKDIE